MLCVPRAKHELSKYRVPGLGISNALSHVIEEVFVTRIASLDHLVEHTANVQRKFRTVDEPIDHFSSLVVRLVREKLVEFICRGDAAIQVEHQSAKKRCGVRAIGRLHLMSDPMALQKTINLGSNLLCWKGKCRTGLF